METKINLSIIPDQLIDVYRKTQYRILEPVNFILKIEEFSQELNQLFADRRVSSAAFITAWNPLSILTAVAENEEADQKLRQTLKDENIYFFDGIAEDPAGSWPNEPSLLALGLTLNKAIIIGKKYSQNAIVWIERDAFPQLRLLR